MSPTCGRRPRSPIRPSRGDSGLTGDLTGVRIGLDPLLGRSAWEAANLPQLIEAAAQTLRDAGATVVPVELPYFREFSAATMVGMPAEAFAYHRPDLQRRWDDYAAGTRSAVVAGALISGGDYVQTQRVRRFAQRKVAELFADIDLVVTPTGSAGAFPIEGLTFKTLAGPLHTSYWNAVGLPAMSVPMGFDHEGLPMGLQIAGKPFDEAAVLAAGYAYQQRTDWHRRVPSLSSVAA